MRIIKHAPISIAWHAKIIWHSKICEVISLASLAIFSDSISAHNFNKEKVHECNKDEDGGPHWGPGSGSPGPNPRNREHRVDCIFNLLLIMNFYCSEHEQWHITIKAILQKKQKPCTIQFGKLMRNIALHVCSKLFDVRTQLWARNAQYQMQVFVRNALYTCLSSSRKKFVRICCCLWALAITAELCV